MNDFHTFGVGPSPYIERAKYDALAAEAERLQIECSSWQEGGDRDEARIRELEAELADSRLIAREQEDAHVAANMRATALEADRDQISLALAVAKADRDKWFNRARDLEATIRWALGEEGEFPDEPEPQGKYRRKYYWRTELRKRARLSAETPVSTLCAVCDQIKELHPNTHPWTAKASVPETLVKPEFDPAWVCGVCGKRHGPDQCLGAETAVKQENGWCPACNEWHGDCTPVVKAETGTKLVWLSSGGNFLENEFYYNCSVCGKTDKPCKHHPETRAKQFTVPALPEGDQICIHCGKGIGYHYQTAAGDLFCEVPKETEGEKR